MALGWPSFERVTWLDRRLGAYAVTVAILGALFATALHVSYDFSIYWAAAQEVAGGGSAYGYTLSVGAENIGVGRIYVYPPFLAHALAPLTFLPQPVAFGLWTAGSVALASWALRRGGEHLGRDWPRLLLASGFLWVSLVLGQVNLLVAAGLILALGSRDDRLAGAGLALAVLLRATPAAFGLIFLFDRRPRAVLWSLGAFGAGVLVGGPAEWQTWLGLVRTLAAHTPLDSFWQTSLAAFGFPWPHLAFTMAALVLLGAGRRHDVRVLRALAIGLALLLVPSDSWFHWFLFALVPLLWAHHEPWGRAAFVSFLTASLIPAPLGGSLALTAVAVATLLAMAVLVLRSYIPARVAAPPQPASSAAATSS